MRKSIFTTVLALIVAAQAISNLEAQVRETPATLGLVQGGNPQGFLQGSDDNGVTFSTVPGQRGKPYAYSAIRGEGLDKAIRIDDRSEALADARALFQAGDYAAAAPAFGAVARNYALILGIPQNFSSEALFYQMESLKRAGKYADLAILIDAPVAKTIETKLGETYQKPHTFQKLWALYGAKKMDELKTALEAYQVPVLGEAKLLRTPNFQIMPTSELVQISFLRAKVYDAAGDKEKALEDYYRTFSLAFANNEFLAKQSMGAAMVIQQADPELASEKNKQPLRQMQSLAFTFSKFFGDSIMPDQFKKYAVRPEIEKKPEPKPEVKEGEAGKEGEAKPAEGDAAAPAAKGKGKGDAPAPAPAAKGKGKGDAPAEKGKAKGKE